LNSRHCSCNLEFIDVGRLLMYNDSEYDKLVKTLNTEPLSRKDTPCCNSWKEYIEQYINNKLIIDMGL